MKFDELHCVHFALDIAITDITTIGEKKWKRAMEKYEQILEPIYEKISMILKSKLHTHLDEPAEIIHIFLQYETILKSADIMELLSAERQHFLQTLHKFVNELKELLAEPKAYPEGSDISSICWETKELKLFQNQVCNVFYYINLYIEYALTSIWPKEILDFSLLLGSLSSAGKSMPILIAWSTK